MRICCFNVENLFLSPLETDQDGEIRQKIFQPGDSSLKKLKDLALVLLDIDADIFALVEVGPEEMLREFSQSLLGDRYRVSVIEGNSDRGIHIGYLIKNDCAFKIEHLTHRGRQLSLSTPQKPVYLSRDIAELRLIKKNKKRPSLILLLVHLKSKRSDLTSDFGGKKKRQSEFHLLLETYQTLRDRYHGKVPILLLGDFNGVLIKDRREPEFEKLKEYPELKDILERLEYSEEERITQISFDNKQNRLAEQFDYMFLPDILEDAIVKEKSGLYLYKTEDGQPKVLPKSSYERSLLPSDHYPLVLELNLASGDT